MGEGERAEGRAGPSPGGPRPARAPSPSPIRHPPAPAVATGLYESPADRGDSPLERLLAEAACVVLRAGWWRFEPGWDQAEHVRQNYTLFVPVGGDAEYRIDGQAHRLRPGTVLLLPPNVPVGGRNDGDEPLALYTIHFHARLYGAVDLPQMFGLPLACAPARDRLEEMVGLARGILAELAEGAPGRALAANGACARLLALLWREAVGGGAERPGATPTAGAAPALVPARAAAREGARIDQAPPASPTPTPGADPRRGAADGSSPRLGLAGEGAARVADVVRLAPAFRVIERDYAERLTVGRLADAVHLHPAYFSTVFKRVTGLSPIEFLARFRLRHARDLLLSTDRSLAQIAAATGYRDPFYLSRVFRRVHGVSPSEYRKSKDRPALP